MDKSSWAPRIILRQHAVDRVPERWARQYSRPNEDASKRAITAALANLTAPIDRDEVDRIIGNKSWTECRCDLCGENREALIRVGDEPDYETRWLDICPLCIS